MTDTWQNSPAVSYPPSAPSAPAAPAPAPAAPPQQSGVDRAIAGFEGSMDRQRELFESGQAALAPHYAALSHTLAQPSPQPPRPTPVAPAPQQQDYHKYSMAFFGAMAVLGAVASSRTRMSGTNALSAFAGALNGWSQGNQQAYENAAHQWEQNTKATIQNNQQELNQYKAVLENRRLNIDQQMAQISMIAAQNRDQMMFEASRGNNFTMVAQIYTARETAQARLATAAESLEERRSRDRAHLESTVNYWMSPEGTQRRQTLTPEQNANIDKMIAMSPHGAQATGQSSLSQAALDSAANRYLQTGTFPPNISRGITGGVERSAIQNRASEIAEERGIDQSTLPQTWQQYQASRTNLQRFQSGPQGNMIRSFSVLADHLGTLDELSKALQNNDVQAVNRIANAFATQTGRPAPTNFNIAKEIIGDEVIKAVVGTGALADRENLKRQFDAARSPAQFAGAINQAIRPLVRGQINGLRQQYETATGRKDFDQLLSPAARDLFLNDSHGGTSGGGAPVRVTSPTEAQRLSPGTHYITPDGREMIR